ncbi:hypothetical protein DY000_02047904 [Brassica cretica]|uniref:DUF4283 domain-containing protein n=1 Tax=Brassica cretica TaxID=69181 RepID=A0ABQ7F1W3_BRACR|nr:hypothetical protein DY000_02047904 [Brassica cretica]
MDECAKIGQGRFTVVTQLEAWKVILLHSGELPTTKELLDKEGAVWIRFPQAREAGDRL